MPQDTYEDTKGMALKLACDVAIAMGNKSDLTTENIIKKAKEFENYLNGREWWQENATPKGPIIR